LLSSLVPTENSVRINPHFCGTLVADLVDALFLLASTSESKDWQSLPRPGVECIQVQGVLGRRRSPRPNSSSFRKPPKMRSSTNSRPEPDFQKALLRGAELAFSYAAGASFRGADLRECSLYRAEIGLSRRHSSADFTDALVNEATDIPERKVFGERRLS
jgi:uncharacterized protein YjbI with pentapeptide repeats